MVGAKLSKNITLYYCKLKMLKMNRQRIQQVSRINIYFFVDFNFTIF
jgi:hypothetical protein